VPQVITPAQAGPSLCYRDKLDIEPQRRATPISALQLTEEGGEDSLLRYPRNLLIPIRQPCRNLHHFEHSIQAKPAARTHGQPPLPANRHSRQSLIPTTDDLPLTKHEREWFPGSIRIELLAILQLPDIPV